MKTLSVKDLPPSDALKLFELGYAAGDCHAPAQFLRVLEGLRDVFPIESVVSGIGKVGKGVPLDKIWDSSELPTFYITQLDEVGWPRDFLQTYFKKNILRRDAQLYGWLRTQSPQLWIELYEKENHPFDPVIKRGLDPLFVEMVFDYGLSFSVRYGQISNGQINGFVCNYRTRKDAKRFSDLLQTFIPYLSNALVRVYGGNDANTSNARSPKLSLREHEILRWLAEGKNNWAIGAILGISVRTVKFHVRNLMQKFMATNRCQLIANAVEQKNCGLSSHSI